MNVYDLSPDAIMAFILSGPFLGLCTGIACRWFLVARGGRGNL